MHFGVHISSAGGVEKIPEQAASVGAECVQFFLDSPYGGKRAALGEAAVKAFKENAKRYKIHSAWVHAPYFINLASKNNRVFYGSVSAIRHDLEGASAIGANGVIMHIGSAKDFGEDNQGALKKAVEGLSKILDGYEGSAELVLEISAGAGQIIGSTLDEIAFFLGENKRIGGFCFDTAHAFESGLELRGKDAVKDAVSAIDKKIGMEKLKLIHCNDSKTPFASHKDRHEHLGMGEIGLPSFTALIQDKRLADIDYILETPTESGIIEDLNVLKGIREQFS